MKLFNSMFLLAISSLMVVSCRKDTVVKPPVVTTAKTTIDTVYAGIIKDSSFFYTINTSFGNLTLDVDQDGVVDFKCLGWYDFHPGLLRAYNEVSIVNSGFEIAVTADSVYPHNFVKGDLLMNYTVWSTIAAAATGPTFILDQTTGVGNPGTDLTYWSGQTGFIGIRRKNGLGNYTYGWLQVQVPPTFFTANMLNFYFR
jgi:hypothetical protein